MCHSFTICSYAELERALREISSDAQVPPPDANRSKVVYPGMMAPVFVLPQGSIEPRQDRLFDVRTEEFGFGWPVEWKQGTVFNARFESLLEGGGMWKDALPTRRCIVPCESFFESHMTEKSVSGRTGKPVKRRYRFTSPDGNALFLGAVFEGPYFSIVTTTPNGSVSPIHDRMPLVLSTTEARKWLDPETPMAWIAKLANREDVALDASADGRPSGTTEQTRLFLD